MQKQPATINERNDACALPCEPNPKPAFGYVPNSSCDTDNMVVGSCKDCGQNRIKCSTFGQIGTFRSNPFYNLIVRDGNRKIESMMAA